MAGTNFKTENNTLRKLLGNGLSYHIPRFQRDYSWGDEEWDDLWLDIVAVHRHEEEPAHYMGYLVLQSEDDKNFDVIDGQQRLTTLSILILAIMRHLQRLIDNGELAEANQARLNQIRSNYIGFLDPVTLQTKSKLSLNRNNDSYFQQYLVPLGKLPVRGFKASEHAMRKASDWFEKKLKSYLEEGDLDQDRGTALAKLLESVADKLFFTVITVSDDLNAYKVFETLNSRGVRLSATDLLKNYLFSVLDKGDVHETEMSLMDDRWERLVSRLGETDLPDFLRIHWISRHGLLRMPELFKTIRTKITERSEVFALLAALDDDIDTYLAMTSPDNSEWPDKSRKLAATLKLFSVRQPYALLIAASKILTPNEFETLLQVITVISFRYNVIANRQAGEQERLYSNVAVAISSGQYQTLKEIISALRHIYPTDDAFRAAFASKELKTTQSRNNRIVKYILAKIEYQQYQNDVDPDSPILSVEHILPQNPETGWDNFPDSEMGASIYRLGNMTLLERAANRDLGNRPFAEKRPAYATSQYQMSRAIAEENDDWGVKAITIRQSEMAKIAVGIWKVSQFDRKSATL